MSETQKALTLNEALRLLRVFHDLTQKELAEKLGIAKSYISEIESGKKDPTLKLIYQYAMHFKVSASSILFFAENLHNQNTLETINTLASSKVLAILNFIAEQSDHYSQES